MEVSRRGRVSFRGSPLGEIGDGRTNSACHHERLNPLRAIKDVVLFPFRLLYAVVQYLNFFSAIYTGRKLTSGGAKARELDMKQMMVWGNVVRSQRQAGVE